MRIAPLAWLAVLTVITGCASFPERIASPHAGPCPDWLRPVTSGTPAFTLRIGAECRLEAQAMDGSRLGTLPLSRAGSLARHVQRIIATPELAFVLRSRPGRLEVYRLPALTPIPIVGDLELVAPVDLAVQRRGHDEVDAYVLDNLRDMGTWSADVGGNGPRLLRVRLGRHQSTRREVLVAQAEELVRGAFSSGRPLALSESIALVDNEIRVVVEVDGRRFAEYFTLDGVRLEQEVLD